MEKCSENNEDATKAILAFDTLYTTNHMKILKLLLPYLECEHQKKLAVFIKWQELVFTLDFFKQYSASLYSSDFKHKKNLDLNALLPLLIPYCNDSEKNLLQQFTQLQNMLHMYEDFQQYLPLLQQFIGTSAGETPLNTMFQSDNNNIINLLQNMMSEEQLAMFTMFMEGGSL